MAPFLWNHRWFSKGLREMCSAKKLISSLKTHLFSFWNRGFIKIFFRFIFENVCFICPFIIEWTIDASSGTRVPTKDRFLHQQTSENFYSLYSPLDPPIQVTLLVESIKFRWQVCPAGASNWEACGWVGGMAAPEKEVTIKVLVKRRDISRSSQKPPSCDVFPAHVRRK